MRKENVYSVSEVSRYITDMFAQDYLLNKVSVKGEISNCTYHSSGHIYFSLKDANAVIRGIMFSSDRHGLKFRLSEGDQVVVTGSVRAFAKNGSYSIYARTIEKQGAGDLYAKFMQLKTELEEMGMFDPMYKQPIPKYVSTVGIVTAVTGAAIRDIQNIAIRRNPYVQLVIYNAQVQGEGAAHSIANGIYAMEEFGPDVIIVGRGGGAIEDLWAFNEKEVAEAIFHCSIPIVSAVGHEVDTTIADYVADLRAPTPSAAAELTIFDYKQFADDIYGLKERFYYNMELAVRNARYRHQSLCGAIQKYNPKQQILMKRQYEADLGHRLDVLMKRILTEKKHRLQLYAERFDGKSPMKKLVQGYSYVTDASAHMVNDVSTLKVNDELKIRMTNGTVTTNVTKIEEYKDE